MLVVAAVLTRVAFLIVDRRADAPVVCRRVNAGTERWHASERQRRRAARDGDDHAGPLRFGDVARGDDDGDDGE